MHVRFAPGESPRTVIEPVGGSPRVGILKARTYAFIPFVDSDIFEALLGGELP